MKRQEICEKTGLTPKALRLYEEKGLIQPDKSGIHNKMRDYSQEDLTRLTIIATLRKAMFTIDEIRQMLDAPDSIQTIFPQYLEWLRQQSRQIQELLKVSEEIDLSRIHDAGELSAQIEGAAEKLPIPSSDIHFRFRQIDEMEEARPKNYTTEQQMDQLLPGTTAYRSSVVAISRDGFDNGLALNTQLNDTMQMDQEESGWVRDREIKLKLWQRLIRWAADLLILASIYMIWRNASFYPGGIGLILFAILRILLAWMDHRMATKSWTDAMGWETDVSEERKRVLKIAAAIFLAVVVIIAGSVGLIELMRPVEPMDGPPADSLDMNEFFKNMPVDVQYQLYRSRALNSNGFAYAIAPNKVYFSSLGALYSIDADYKNLLRISKQIVCVDDTLTAVDAPEEQPSMLIYTNGKLYYIAPGKSGNCHLMYHESGTKVHPQKLLSGEFTALGLSEAGEIILYNRVESQWTEIQRISIVQ